jgi:hypothetical protein
MKRSFCRVGAEIGFIIFLFYANLLMGEYTLALMHRDRGMVFAVEDIFIEVNFCDCNRRRDDRLSDLRVLAEEAPTFLSGTAEELKAGRNRSSEA